jgi:hypothetical protein
MLLLPLLVQVVVWTYAAVISFNNDQDLFAEVHTRY